MPQNKSDSKVIFKNCSLCGKVWEKRRDFLSDPEIFVIGYQPDFKYLEEGLFLFNHSCGTTVAIKAQYFIDLNNGPIFQERLHNEEECFGYCNVRDNLEACSNKCECAYVRDTLQIVRNWPKNGAQGS